MRDNTVTVDTNTSPSTIQFAPVFNVAVPFVDRHLDEGRSGNVAIRTVQGDVTYGELAERVNRCGNLLRGLGIDPGGRVLMVVKDCPEFVYLFWGAVKAGIVPVPVNTMLRAADYRYMIEDSGCAAVVYSPEFAAEVRPALDNLEDGPAVVLETEGEISMTQRLGDSSATLAPASATPDDDCFWLYSSGSTGRPKGVVHRHRDIVVTCVRYAVETLGMTEGDVCFSAAKLFFAYGLGNAMTFPMWLGAASVLSDLRPTPEMTFEIIDRFRPTLYFGVPTLYASQL